MFHIKTAPVYFNDNFVCEFLPKSIIFFQPKYTISGLNRLIEKVNLVLTAQNSFTVMT